MATKRDENYCRDCCNTWFPRGKDLSDRCPSCKSENVTFESLRNYVPKQPVAELTPWHQGAPQVWRQPGPVQPVPPAPSVAKPVLIALSIAFGLAVLGLVGLLTLATLVPAKKAAAASAPVPTHAPRR